MCAPVLPDHEPVRGGRGEQGDADGQAAARVGHPRRVQVHLIN